VFSFSWRESGGPRVPPPTREGYGTRLLKNAISGADVKVNIEYPAEGVHYTIEALLADIASSPGGNEGDLSAVSL
jgi:two-component sensor histidine kinase